MRFIRKEPVSIVKVFIVFGIISLLLVIFVIYLVNRGVIYQQDGPSMLPTIQHGQKFGVKSKDFSEINRNDIIAHENPENTEQRLVKRVIGIPGDTIKIHDGGLFIKKPDENKFVKFDDRETKAINDSPSLIKVEDNTLYVLGDNRSNSLDSRHFGLVKKENFIGIANL